MTFTPTTTAIGFSLLSLGLAFCGVRFFRAFQKIGGQRAGGKIGIFLSATFISHAVALGILAMAVLFFAQNPEILNILLVASHFYLMLAAIFSVYALLYIFFPSVLPWPAVAAAFSLGIAVILLTIITPPHPFIDASGGIDWNMPRLLAIFLSYLLFTTLGAQLAIFIPSFLQAKSREVKVVSLTIIVVSLMGIVNIFTRFLLPRGITPDSLRTRIFDVLLAIIGLIFVSVFLLPTRDGAIRWFSRIINRIFQYRCGHRSVAASPSDLDFHHKIR